MVSQLDSYLGRIEDLHSQISGVIAGLPTEAVNWRPIEGKEEHATNSIAVIASHVAGAEHFWIGEVVGHRPETRDRDAEFATVATNAEEIILLLEMTELETREVLCALSESDLDGTRPAGGRTLPVRWCVLHVIDHAALHLGHMQITYQLWSGGKSMPSPLWFERLPPNQDS
jgi:uncharacterized damage-inducible protein DinB